MSLSSQPQPRPLNIALVSDFFYPNLGGVEMHIYSLAYCLMERGHKVIILTRAYENRQGIRYISNGIKCYYLPLSNWPIGTIIFPAVVLGVNYLLIRDIFFREKIDICHCHQSTSTLVIDITNIAYNLGVRTVLTDHSTWNLHDFGYIDISKLWKVCSMVCDHYIAVSHAVRENFVVRSNLDPVRTSTIPNAIDTSKFKPDPTKRNPLGTINIVVMSRLEYKKGFDLLVEAIPAICKKYPNAYWIIGGDGSKMPVLKFLVKKCGLESQVEILGMVPHHLVQDVLNRGHIFINTSIAEAFCIAVLEAVACGLKVVSTNVGGIPEILPKDMVLLAEANSESLLSRLEEAVKTYKDFNPGEFNKRISNYYSWRDVAERTDAVYQKVLESPRATWAQVFLNFILNWTHWILAVGYTGCWVMGIFASFFYPKTDYETAIKFPKEDYMSQPDVFGDHNYTVTDPKLLDNKFYVPE